LGGAQRGIFHEQELPVVVAVLESLDLLPQKPDIRTPCVETSPTTCRPGNVS
jgi:hypothetical protein